MKLDRLISFFSTNPSAKLLRSPHAAYITHFLYQHFKVAGNLVTPHSILQQQLDFYLDQLHETHPEVLLDRAESYLHSWSTGDGRWLWRFHDAQHAESVYQLSPHTEEVLKFLTAVLDRDLGFVGTESRLTRIIQTLSDIVVRGSSDPERRLQHLYTERKRIEEEIRSIESGNAISTHSPTAVRERFADVISDLVSLQGDFRAVEESFKNITREVQKQQATWVDTRGDILGFALDAEDRLKEEDQGASFQAFVQLILSHSQQDELERMIRELDGIAELEEQVEGKQRVKGMIRSLSAEAEKVLHTTRRLSATLRRLLDSRAGTTRMRLVEVLREIRAAAATRAEDPPDVGMELYTELELLNVGQRTFWEPPIEFAELALSNQETSGDDSVLHFRRLAEMQHLDWDGMRARIETLLKTTEQLPLPELLELHPPAGGTIEVLGYIQLAHDDGHQMNEDQLEVVWIDDPDEAGASRPYEIPRVIFLSERLRLLCQHLGPEAAHDD